MAEDQTILAGRYRLLRSIGEGGAGVVYEALHEDLGKRVAVKLLHPNRAQDETVSKRFRREARAIAAIGHRAIVDVYDIGRSGSGALFLVMELLKGQTLRELLRKEGVLESSLVTYVMGSVLSALEAAHRTGIVHRDIKPENIYLVRTGQHRPAVKLLDFGVSRFTDPALEDTKLTQSNAILGTPLYMSPEQAAGERDVDHLTDIYATGAVMYESLTGRPPFMADNLLALAAKIQTERPHRPRELRPEITEELEVIVLKAIERDRDKRFPSAAAFLDRLLPLVGEVDRARISFFEPPSSPPSSPPEADELAETAISEDDAEGLEVPQRELTSEPSDERALIEQADTLGPTVSRAQLAPGRLKRRRAPLLVIAGVVVVGLIGALSIVALSPWSRDQHVIGATTMSNEPASKASSSAPSAQKKAPSISRDETRPVDEASVDGAPVEQVSVTLEGVPAKATIRVDGVPVAEETFTLERSDREVPVEVSAPGYQPWRGTVSARESASIGVQMRRRLAAQPRGKKTGGGPGSSTKTLPSFGVGP